MISSQVRRGCALLGASLLLTCLQAASIDWLDEGHADFARPWDHHKYLHMAAQGPFDFHVAPFCWRVLAPWLARALPLELEWSFFLVSACGVWGASLAMFCIGRKLFGSDAYGWLGLLLFHTIHWAGRNVMHNIWSVEPLAFLFIAWGIYAIVVRKDLPFLACMAVGVAAKESVIFIAPLYYTLNTDRLIDGRLLLRCVLLMLPALAVLGGIRLLIPALNDDPAYLATLPERLRLVHRGVSDYDFLELLRTIGRERSRDISLAGLRAYTYGTFGVAVTLLPLLAPRRNIARLSRTAPYLLLVYAQLLFAVNTERLLVLGFPVLLVMALEGIRSVQQRSGRPLMWFAAGALVFVLFNVLSVSAGIQALILFVVLVLVLQGGHERPRP